MNGFEVYKTYLALKQHFSKESYDYFKYGGKVSASVKSFESRRDKYYFEKLSKHSDPKNLILSNMIDRGHMVWIGEMAMDETSDSTYRDWRKRRESLTYTFKNDLSKLDDDFDSNFSVESLPPRLLKLYVSKSICIETLVILIDMTKCYRRWSRAMEYDPVWRDVDVKIRKYQPFMTYDLSVMKKIVIDKFK